MNGFQRIPGLAVCLLLSAAVARAEAPRLQASHGAAKAAAGCAGVSWLDPRQPPAFLTDVGQAAGSGDCQFHEFASQNLFALVLGPSPAIRTWPTAEQVFPTTAEGPTTCASAPLGSTVGPLLRKVSAAATAVGVGEIIQATGEPLVDQDGRYVQYEIRVNPQLCEVVSRCQLYKKQCVAKALGANPAFRFPAGDAKTPGVAEVKLAWRVMETCDLPDSPSKCKKDNLTDFLTVKQTVEPYSPKNQGAMKVTLGLVGFHLIQKTPSRPEFVWATWEHVSNAPVCAGVDNSVCQDPSAASAAIGTASGWSLANPPASNEPNCKEANPPNCANQAYYNKEAASQQPTTQVCRVYPCGSGDQSDIASLNKAIRAKLGGNVWSRYFLVGTLWGNKFDPAAPLPNEPVAAGSIYLANTTMETFIQVVQEPPVPQSCFACHRYQAQGTNLDFTHSLVRAQQPRAGQQWPDCPVDINTCAAVTTPGTVRSSQR